MRKLMFIGDSIACSEGVSPHLGWVNRIAADLPPEWTVFNMSFTGDTTRLALEKMPVTINKHRPDFVIVQLGMNDCNYWETDGGVPRVSFPAYMANLDEIRLRAFVHDAEIVLFMTSHPTPLVEKLPYADISYEESRRSYANGLRNGMYHGSIIDMEDMPTGGTLPDGVHLSQTGNDYYYSVVGERVMECVSSF
jgi:lysophospholipase L1-like esterase